jgi:ATP/maltotriose-dependent transcriptional regulator MalT/DNA-binding SARP family transcriptional activator
MLFAGLGGYMTNPLPVQPAKIHCPPLRADMLSRGRLTTWLDRAAAGRVVLIVAEAGFGKTTLLADWATHSKRVTSWYRLEHDDRDWLTFVRHLVAGGREADPDFAPDTFGMLQALGPGGPTRQDLIATIAREMADFGAARAAGFTLIIDDYHVVDDCPDVAPIVRALLDRTGPGFSVVLSSRSVPSFPMGKVKARGGVDSLDGEALCFDRDETERLFRDAYHRPLQDDVLTDLVARTEGWAALLALVRTSLTEDGGPDPRALVTQLSATHGDLYEFLAEEVLAGLPGELQRFLTRVAILTAVDPETAVLVDDRPIAEVAASIRHCESLGLLNRPDRESPHRFHPLVREFLVTHLEAEIGREAVSELHVRVADRLTGVDWQRAAWHYVQAGAANAAAAVIDAAIDEILAEGSFEQAVPFLDWSAGDPARVVALVLISRIELDRGHPDKAASKARSAVVAAGAGPERGLALLNLASVLSVGGFADEGVRTARMALAHDLSEAQRLVSQATVTVWEASEEGDLDRIADSLRDLAAQQERQGLQRYAGISRLNLAAILTWLGDGENALREATRAEVILGGRPNASVERIAATATRCIALAQLGRLEEAAAALSAERAAASSLARDELALEAARVHGDFGSVADAASYLAVLEPDRLTGGYRGVYSLARGVLAMREGDLRTAAQMCDGLSENRSPDAAGRLRAQLLRSRVALAQRDRRAGQELEDFVRLANCQGSRPARQIGFVLQLILDGEPFGDELERIGPSDAFALSLIAEELSGAFDRLTPGARAIVYAEARLRPARWSSALAMQIARDPHGAPAAGQLLAEIGTGNDASFLRAQAGMKKALKPAALRITQRLAQTVFVRDLGPVNVFLGHTSLRPKLRRKVLAMLCFLTSRPDMAATKDETLEALWPDLSPDTGTNSLNQTIYSLRRVFEPDYREGASAGFVQFDGEVVSLNSALIDSSSRRCWRLLRRVGGDTSNAAEELMALYPGRYALDFAYEDWASSYRENLHAAVLAAGEASIAHARRAQDFDWAIRIGHDLLAVDPQADAIELELLKTYKASGRHAAAAEQYAHYAAQMREEMGVDVPSLDQL